MIRASSKCTDQFCEVARFPKNAGTEAAGLVPGASQSSLRAEPVHDRDHAENHLGRHYREIDRDVNALLNKGHPPLVVVGVEHEVALFHRLTTYPACLEPGITGLPGHLGQNEMYQQSLELVRSVTTGPARRALERFDKQIGAGHASEDVQEIVRAASTGRVEHLFLLENGAVPGAADGGADLLDTAAVQTLRHGGDVQILLESSMPSGGPICANLPLCVGGLLKSSSIGKILVA